MDIQMSFGRRPGSPVEPSNRATGDVETDRRRFLRSAMLVGAATWAVGGALPAGSLVRPAVANSGGSVQLFGHVTLVEGYALPNFLGCHALVALRDSPGTTVAVITKVSRLQSLLESALVTGYLIGFYGKLLSSPPTPRGGSWNVPVYGIDGVTDYNFV
jgi:hypothetical protein